MKILIISHGRSGSTMLLYALSDVLNLEKIIEPFNKNLWDNADNFPNLPDKPNYQSGDIPNNTITKVITNQNNDWIYNYANQFDKIILIARESIKDTIESAQNALVYGYNKPYVPTEKITPFVMADSASLYLTLFQMHESFSDIKKYKKINSDLIWYNDIYKSYEVSKKTIQSLNLNISDDMFHKMWIHYFNPRHRLRMGS